MKKYHATLHCVVRDHGVDDFQYSFDELVDDYKIGQSIGLVFCMFALPMVLAEPDDTIEFADVDFTDKEQGQYYKNFFCCC